MTASEQRRDQDQLSEAHLERTERRQADQDRTLLAMQQLEAALGAAAPRREQAWLVQVCQALTVLAEAAREEAENAGQPDSLLSDIARTQRWLRNRVRGLRIHYRQLQDGITALQHELNGNVSDRVDFTDIRQRLGWILAGLRHQRARESDLIYEAYYDAFRTDLVTEANGSSRPADASLKTLVILGRQIRAARAFSRRPTNCAAGLSAEQQPRSRAACRRLIANLVLRILKPWSS